jgi:hypothetical protein
MATVDGKLVRNWTGGRHFLENALPDAALGPMIEAVVDGRWRPMGWRNVAPPASSFQHMQNAGNDGPIVDARFSRHAARQMRLQRLLSLIRQQEQAPCHDPRLQRLKSGQKYIMKSRHCMGSKPILDAPIGGAYAPRTRLRNSSRVRGSSRITPSRRLVVSVDPSVLTPRNVMQLCSASMTTPTPCGSRMS